MSMNIGKEEVEKPSDPTLYFSLVYLVYNF